MSTGSSRKTEKNGKRNPHRHCEEVCTDPNETREVQEKRMECVKKKGDTLLKMGGELRLQLTWCCRAKMSENKVNGPEDEMIKQLLLEKIYSFTMCFQERFFVQMDAPSSWKIVKLVFPAKKTDAKPKQGIRSYRAIALTSVMSKWYVSCIILRREKEKEPEIWKKLN